MTLIKSVMKNIFLSLIFALIAISSFAQIQSSDHLTFKGVPIDGTLNEYVSKMKQNGFTHTGTEDGVAMLTGDFAAYKNCIVGVVTLKQKDLVSKITVIFPESDTWSLLSSNYFSLKEMLTQKYGKPSECVEKFDSYSKPMMMAIECTQLKWITANITQLTKLIKAVLSCQSSTRV